jgi:hypothetical protein
MKQPKSRTTKCGTNLSKLLGLQEQATGLRDRRFPTPELPAAPTGIRRFNSQIVCQIVAGLWLKYGVEPSKIEALSRRKNKTRDATIC